MTDQPDLLSAAKGVLRMLEGAGTGRQFRSAPAQALVRAVEAAQGSPYITREAELAAERAALYQQIAIHEV